MCITQHKYIVKYPINSECEFLILGTIHPHNDLLFKFPFFYGNVGSLWDIVGNACNIQFNYLNNILHFLKKYKICLSDMILECHRDNCKETADSKLKNLVLNQDLLNQILESNIETIFFTSGYGKNNATKLFLDTFNSYITNKNDIDKYQFTIKLSNQTKCKYIKCIVLLSPSNSANRSIPKTLIYKNNSVYYPKTKGYTKGFKIDFYKEKFAKIIGIPNIRSKLKF